MVDYVPTIISSIISLLIGFGAGWWSHFLASRRDRENRTAASKVAATERRRSFISFMDRWRSEIERCKPIRLAEEYTTKVPSFREAAAKVEGDIAPTEQFSKFVQQLSGIGRSLISDTPYPQNRDIILEPLDQLVRIMKEAQQDAAANP